MYEGRFGNEWIDYDQPYYKILLSEDGVYRISYQTLIDGGLPMAGISGQQFQLFLRGEEQAIYTSTEGNFGNADYIEFCGKKNRTEIDRYLFEDPDNEILSPNYSLYTDTSAYFLTWTNGGNGQRYQTINNELNNLPPKEAHFTYEQFYDAPERKHNKFYQNSDGVAFSNYATTEGFGFGLETNQTLTIAPEFLVVAGGNSELRIRFGTGLGVHHKAISLNGNEVYNEENIQPYSIRDLQFEVASSSVSNEISVDLNGLNSLNDKSAIGMMSLVYPRSFNFSGQSFFTFNIDGNGGKQYLEIENFAAGGQNPVLYNLTTQQRMIADLSNDLVRIALPTNSANQELFLSNNGGNVQMIDDLERVDFIDYRNQEVQYLIISNSRLFNDGQGNNRIQEYANYRSSVNGGGYSTLIVDVQQLYDQYAFGVHRHPLSVRNFVQNIAQEWNDLKYIFIIGKGREYEKVRSHAEMQTAQSTLFVPTYGFPGADNLLLAEIGRDYPAIPFGRIAAVSPNDVRIYLDKVRVLED
ncbi:MAG: C25 family cysteine peptidase, partial [Bacteroidota bacterium]